MKNDLSACYSGVTADGRLILTPAFERSIRRYYAEGSGRARAFDAANRQPTRNERIQAAYDAIRTGAARRAGAARATDTAAPAKPDFGCRASDLPYFHRAGGRATDATEDDIFNLEAVERSTSAMYRAWVGR